MKKMLGGAILAVLIAGLAGCTLKMGNTSLGLFEGWNQPSANVQKSETLVTPPMTTTVTTIPAAPAK